MKESWIFIPSKPGDWLISTDIMFQPLVNDRTLSGFIRIVLCAERNPVPHVRIVGCLWSTVWCPVALKSQNTHEYWNQKQIQICRNVQIEDSSSPCLCIKFHYAREFLLLKLGTKCVSGDFEDLTSFIGTFHSHKENFPLLSMCDREPFSGNQKSVQLLNQYLKDKWKRSPKELKLVQDASDLRQKYLAQQG